jgi:hypothetical protein
MPRRWLQRPDTSQGLVGDGPDLSPSRLRSPVTRSSAWIFQPMLSLGNHEAGSGRPVAKEA